MEVLKPNQTSCSESECDLNPRFQTLQVIQYRYDGSVSFAQNWEAYSTGFGNLAAGEFWLGNEKVHNIVTDGKYELLVLLQPKSGSWGWGYYQAFSLAGEDDNYRLTVSGYSGSHGKINLSCYLPQPLHVFFGVRHWYIACQNSKKAVGRIPRAGMKCITDLPTVRNS